MMQVPLVRGVGAGICRAQSRTDRASGSEALNINYKNLLREQDFADKTGNIPAPTPRTRAIYHFATLVCYTIYT